MKQPDLIEEFKKRSALVSTVLHEAATEEEALQIAVSLCSPGNIIAAPELELPLMNTLKTLCHDRGIILKTDGLRYMTGETGGFDAGPARIETGLTTADFGIAETGTIVVSSDSEEKRLATMLSEKHVALLKKEDIRETALQLVDELAGLMKSPSSYTAFITGPSRTADIERVLAIGVHGPLELHVIIICGMA